MAARKTKRLCIVCHKNPPEVPDRERMGRPIKRVCHECHGNRLMGDLAQILAHHRHQPPTV